MPALRDRHDTEDWIRRWEQQRGRRSIWDSHWQEIAELALPGKNEFFGRRSATGGEKRTEKILDVTLPIALERSAAIFTSVVMPQQQRYQRLVATDRKLNKDSSVKEWFDESTQILLDWRASPRANFYAQAHEGWESILGFGNHCLFVDDMPGGGVRYQNVHIGQVWIDIDPQRRVDTIFRRVPLSAKAAHQQFGKAWGDKPPAKIEKALKTGSAELFEFLHITAPRFNVDPESLGPESKPYLSLYVFPEDKQLIDEGAFEEFPYMYPRWSLSPAELHGRCPTMTVLPKAKVLNEQERTVLRAGHNQVDPAVLMREGGLFGGSKRPRIVPGGIVPGGLDMQGREMLKPFQTGARLDLSRDMMQDGREAINQALFLTLFQILAEQPKMTATEVLERAQEKGQMLAPAIGRIHAEWLGPMTHRELKILGRQGYLPPLPRALREAGRGYQTEYTSPATRLQRAEELAAIQRTWEIMAPHVALDPKQALLFKAEEIGRLSMDILGGPSSVLRTPEELQEMLAAIAQQEAQAQQAAMAQQGAETMHEGAQALSVIQGGRRAA